MARDNPIVDLHLVSAINGSTIGDSVVLPVLVFRFRFDGLSDLPTGFPISLSDVFDLSGFQQGPLPRIQRYRLGFGLPDDVQISQFLVATPGAASTTARPPSHAGERFVDQRFGLGVFAGQQQLTDFRQIPRRALAIPIDRCPGPYRFLIQSNPFLQNAAEDHGPQTTIADRQSFALPVFCRPRIPKRRGGVLPCRLVGASRPGRNRKRNNYSK
jgi:hypothetical protein